MSLSVLQYCYNTLLIIVYTSVIAFSACITWMQRRSPGANLAPCLPLLGLFAFFLLDAIVIDLTEFVPEFSTWYNQIFVTSPSIKTVVYLGSAFFTMYFYAHLKGKPITLFHGIVIIALGLWYIFVPMLGMGAIEVYFYFIIYQIFIITACLYALRDIPKCDIFTEEQKKTLKLTMAVTIAFSLLIVLEDTYVIFFVDTYTEENLHIYDRNRSEDLLRLVYAALFYGLFLRMDWRTHAACGTGDAEASAPPEENTAQEAASSTSTLSENRAEEYKQFKFAQQLYLTERELEVFSLVLQGKNNHEISDALTISMGTVKAHIHNIYHKADVTRRYELVRLYEAFQPEDG